MIVVKTIRLLHLFSYLLVTTQLLFYLFLMGDALKLIGIESFVEQRQVVDRLIQQRHVPVYYACLVLSILIPLLLMKNWQTPAFVSCSLALLCLLGDILLAQKEAGPLNTIFHAYSPANTGIDWENLRDRWLVLIKIRGAISTVGFVSLLTGLLWTKP